jgi:TM2 domain-containing membrane protein YozV
MDQNNIDMFMSTSSKNFSKSQFGIIRNQLEKIDNNKFLAIQSQNYRSPLTMFLISFFFGWLGIDRFMIGSVGLGILKLLTAGGFGFLWFIDLFLISSTTKKKNFQMFAQIAH